MRAPTAHACGLAVAAVLLAALPAGAPSYPTGGPLDPLRVRVLAVAPFSDEASLSWALAEWGSERLSEMLSRGPFRIIGSRLAADEAKRLGIPPAGLISPTRTVELGRRLGADAVLTAGVTQLLQEVERDRSGPGSIPSLYSLVVLRVRVLEVSSRLILFEDEFGCHLADTARSAMECTLRAIALRLIGR